MKSSPVRVIALSTGTILRTIGILLALGVLWMIRDIILYGFAALLLAGMIYPFAAWVNKRRIPKLAAVLGIYLLLFGVIAFLIVALIPALVEQSRAFITTYGDQVGNLSGLLDRWKSVSGEYAVGGINLSDGLRGLQSQVQGIFTNVFGTISGIFGGIAAFVLILVLTLYIVIEDFAIKRVFEQWVPREYQEIISRITWLMMERLGAWMRGQLLLCLIIGVLYLVVFAVLGVPYALLLAVIGGLLEFIPYIGPLLSAIPAVLLALTVSPATALFTLIALLIIQQLENNLIVPKVMERAVGLNPIVSILVFLIGAKLFGVPGAIFSIPVTVAFWIGWSEWMNFRKGRSV